MRVRMFLADRCGAGGPAVGCTLLRFRRWAAALGVSLSMWLPLLVPASAFAQGNATPSSASSGEASSPELDRAIDELDLEVTRLEAARAVKTLQRAFGYYVDRALWNEAADLFAPDGTIELGADGTYVGRARIREYLRRLGGDKIGLPYGRLAEHYQLQPVVDIAADAKTAKGRWRDFALLGQYKKAAAWGDGIYENEYVKRNGVWMIKSMHLYVNFTAPYSGGWARLKAPGGGQAVAARRTLDFAGGLDSTTAADWRSEVSKAFPPDRLPKAVYPRFPQSFVPPFHYSNPAGSPNCQPHQFKVGDPRVARYEHQVELLCDHDAVENLQDAYGYYFDKNLWDEVAKLFSDDATFEYGQRGVYVGRKHIREALQLFGPEGPHRGWLNNHMQLQPVIHVADDERTAKGRWEGILQLAKPNADGVWGLGVYENEYVKEHGAWKISKLHFYVTALADYDLTWNKGSIPLAGPSAVLPPDRPPSEIYRSLPGVYIPPFHYRHPVTHEPIVTDPQPADSIIRSKRGAP